MGTPENSASEKDGLADSNVSRPTFVVGGLNKNQPFEFGELPKKIHLTLVETYFSLNKNW